MFRILISGLIISFLFCGCQKPDVYSDIPAITYKSVFTTRDDQGYDSEIYFTIGFTDGDGDIGYYTDDASKNNPLFNDTSSAYYFNFVVKSFKKTQGNWTMMTDVLSGRIPYLTQDGKNKALRGDIQQFNFPPDSLTYSDTVRFDIYIYDRGLHQSNTISTPEMLLHTYQ